MGICRANPATRLNPSMATRSADAQGRFGYEQDFRESPTMRRSGTFLARYLFASGAGVAGRSEL